MSLDPKPAKPVDPDSPLETTNRAFRKGGFIFLGFNLLFFPALLVGWGEPTLIIVAGAFYLSFLPDFIGECTRKKTGDEVFQEFMGKGPPSIGRSYRRIRLIIFALLGLVASFYYIYQEVVPMFHGQPPSADFVMELVWIGLIAALILFQSKAGKGPDANQ